MGGDLIMQTSNLNYKQISATSLLILILAVISGCGGGGDDGEVVEIPADIPELLNYEIHQSTGISLNLNQGGGDATVTSTSLVGTFNRITEEFTLNIQPAAMTVSAADFLSVLDMELGNVHFSDYRLHVINVMSWVGDNNPTSGVFDIFDDAVRKITVSVNPDVNNTGMPGVDVTYWPNGEGDPGSSVLESFTWDELDAVFDDTSADAYARIASFAYSMLRFMYEQSELVIHTLEFLGDNDASLEQIGSIAESCDTFPLAPLPPALDPGMSKVSWYDASHDNSLGSGDTFYLDFTECWDDDETDDFDTLYDGTVNFVNYTELESGGVLTRIGFEPTAGLSGIDFDYLEITETETTVSNVILETSETITLNGGFSMVFTSP